MKTDVEKVLMTFKVYTESDKHSCTYKHTQTQNICLQIFRLDQLSQYKFSLTILFSSLSPNLTARLGIFFVLGTGS